MPAIPEDLLPLLARALPDADPRRAVPLGEGWNAVAWRLPHPAGDWVVRIPRVEYARGEIERQTCLGPRLAAAGIPVPLDWQVARVDHGEVAFGLYRYVDGVPAPRSGATRLKALAGQLADLLTRLHAIPLEVPLACGAQLHRAWPQFYLDLIDGWFHAVGPKTRVWLARVREDLTAAIPRPTEEVLLHTDLAPWHLVSDNQARIRAVLDFLGPCSGDAALDFGRLVQHWGPDFAEAVLAGYDGATDPGFRQRMRMYGQLEALATIRAATGRGIQQWVVWGRRRLAATAASAFRRQARD